jgi:hypothetical protein
MGTGTDSVKKYTTGQVAKLIGVCPSSVKNWTPKLSPTEKTPGGHRRYTDVHIAELRKLCGNEDEASASPPVVSETETPNADHS